MAKQLEDFAVEYADRLRTAIDRNAESRQVVIDIRGLTYVRTGEPLSSGDRLRITNLIYEELVRPTTVAGPDGRVQTLKEADNKMFLQLVQSLQTLLAD